MKIAVVTKPNAIAHPTRSRILGALECDGGFSIEECTSYPPKISIDTDAVLVFGGDGTVLDGVRAAEQAMSSGAGDIAVLGINLGNLGFLTSFEQDADEADIIRALKSGERTSRMLLDVELDKINTALNEVVIKTSGPRPITLEVYVDGKFVDSIHSDGIIVSTPIGSTAYSLSAGGPVLAPSVDAFVINPVCAHSLHSRPLVVNATSFVEIKLVGDSGATVTVDGKEVGNISGASDRRTVKVTKSSRCARFIGVNDGDFYFKLLQKMNRWGTTLR